jgi:hypothetical protein
MSAPFRTRRSGVRATAVSPGSGGEFKGYLERLVKMIPVEVVGLYLIGSGIIPEGQRVGLLVWSIVCLIAVVVVRAYGTADPQKSQTPQWSVVLISSGAFVIWIYSLGGPFKLYALHVPFIGSLLVLAWTFFVPIFYKGTPD